MGLKETNMRDFDKRFQARRDEIDRDFAKAKRTGKIIAAVVIPFYVIGALLILCLLALAVYGLARYLGLTR